ncbi:UrcA family protein [Sphingomicrobium astaxanthinifaciens]|uniref:UrcA family protein n=1 Tax=Sphingomicrobium astaxanthinifaciens TaxID=1227949 RepID=UPI001FCAE642|nr:UrcA family protein [Sphingomicrobium astaxanthinifaciens]MCJ7421924.1 UrcA family protein [Sphingomicrobium astaxanthinifaciens]
MKRTLIALAGATLLAAPALAGEPIEVIANDGEAVQASIYHGDLDLQSLAGNEALKGRVTKAARAMCMSPGFVPVRTWSNEKRCFSTAQADGYAQADALFASPRGQVIVETILITAR